MAEFGIRATQLSAPQGAGANPVQGVSTPAFNSLAVSIPQGITQILGEGVKAVFQQADPSQEILKKFTRESNAVAEGYKQGVISAAEAIDRKQALFREYSSEFPELIKPLQEIGGWTGKYSGFEDAEAKLKLEAENKQKFYNRASQAGFYIDDNTPQATVESVQAFLAEIDQTSTVIGAQQQKLTYASGVDNYQASVEARKLEKKTQEAALSMASSMFDAVNANIEGIRMKLEAGDPNMNPELALNLVRDLSAKMSANVAQLEILDPARATAIRRVLEQQIANAEKLFDPNTSADVKAGLVKNMVNQGQLTVLSNPDVLASAVMQDLFGNTDVLMLPQSQAVINGFGDLMKGYENPNHKTARVVGSGNREVEKGIYKTFKESVDAWKAGTLPQASQSEAIGYLSEAANNILDQFGSLVNDRKATPNDYLDALDLMRSDQFREVVRSGRLSPEAVADAETALVYGFRESQAVRGRFNEKLRSTFKMPQSTLSYGESDQGNFEYIDALMPKFDKASGTLSFGIDPEFQAGIVQRQAINSVIKEFDNSKQALNYSIKAHANLLNMDVGEYWEQYKSQILPEYFPDPSRLKPGDVHEGMEYIGGPPARKSSWRTATNGEGDGGNN